MDYDRCFPGAALKEPNRLYTLLCLFVNFFSSQARS